nr:cilia- and flagella-associated protein 45-like [Leptinotarsa decemlineata]
MPLTGKFHSRAKQAKITGQHNPQQCNHSLNGTLIHYIPKKATEGKEMIKTIDAEGSRDLIVPNRYPIDRPAILGTSEFQRLKKQAHVSPRIIASSKTFLRLKELMIEQDDRVKVANGVILAAKCRAIRNAQIAEKKLIEKQLQEENKRLDMMMEQQRQKLIQIEAQKRESDDKKKQRYVVEVKQQIKENEIGQLLEAEKIEEESRMLNKALIALQKDEEEKMQKKKETQMKMREEFRRANDEAKHYKTLREEEQRISDMRIQEFMRQKAEREEAREKEMVISRATKEKEIARLRAQQEKSRDYQAIMDELNALRSQEEKEREWRENEKVAAKKKLEIISDLRAARAKQIEDIRKAQAVSLARDEEDFMKVAKVQRELFEKDLEEQKKKKEQIAQHRKELLKQINEKERERINWQQEKFEDGKAQRLEFEVKDRNVEDYLKLKMEKLKEHNLPEQYISDIERQLKLKK